MRFVRARISGELGSRSLEIQISDQSDCVCVLCAIPLKQRKAEQREREEKANVFHLHRLSATFQFVSFVTLAALNTNTRLR